MALGALDRSDDRPPYRQIADHLRAAIERGNFDPVTDCRPKRS